MVSCIFKLRKYKAVRWVLDSDSISGEECKKSPASLKEMIREARSAYLPAGTMVAVEQECCYTHGKVMLGIISTASLFLRPRLVIFSSNFNAFNISLFVVTLSCVRRFNRETSLQSDPPANPFY